MTTAQRKAYKLANIERAASLKLRQQCEGSRAVERAEQARRELCAFRYDRALREWRRLGRTRPSED